MPRGFSGSGQEVSKLTAIPSLFVKDVANTSATVYWASAPDTRRSGYRYKLKNLTAHTEGSIVTVAGSGMSISLTGLTANKQYEIQVENLYGSGVTAHTFQPSTVTSVIFKTTNVAP
jgi:hypothetical protein